ncbi:MAG: Rrf2 family transcriptional regulator [Candidatus Omnitrophica bacterium]|nr:Rrf2 family transcriptional regulator [Candidatus Omnitrophota bacterium]
MKLITRNTDYALRALCYMLKHQDVVSVDELVKKLNVPRPFMRKILQQLSKEGILESCKGQKGGFKLKVACKKIHIIKIMRIFQGQMGRDGCFLKKNVCPNRPKCVLRKKLHLIEDNIFRQLQKITVASLI